jgi:uncharacterized membrane protein
MVNSFIAVFAIIFGIFSSIMTVILFSMGIDDGGYAMLGITVMLGLITWACL